MLAAATRSTRTFPAQPTRAAHKRPRPYRPRGEAQREILLHIIEHKETHNGRTPTYDQLAEYMQYSHPMCARSVVMGIVNRNRPDRPYLIYVNDRLGWHWLDFDPDGHLIAPEVVVSGSDGAKASRRGAIEPSQTKPRSR